ncbi:D-methionine transport system permease protein [Pseudoscardovia suis]|jgi:D-methionine transport system permease protein|uniref:Methionine ABC transporter permease n=2 Tax=Pseudoscardovia suis TaxID=987063 RepID=A0A261F1L4_9BIFI|nr:methionine ABC transporter permease [Pseudoscardovia suis]PJJ68471.1 D-methionine transport system permease protein [Pseudoscardovia suis]
MSTWQILQSHLPQALLETLYMVVISAVVGVVLGGLVGVLLYLTENRLLCPNRVVNAIVGFIVNAIRSLPFLILLVVLIPVVQFFLTDPYTPSGGAIALSVAAVPYFARLSESSFSEVDPGIVEASVSTGATVPQILWGAVYPQARPSLVRGIVIMVITLIGSSAMVGTIGAGGIGDMAIQYGYNRYETGVLAVIVVILIVIVQVIQWFGNRRAKALTH